MGTTTGCVCDHCKRALNPGQPFVHMKLYKIMSPEPSPLESGALGVPDTDEDDDRPRRRRRYRAPPSVDYCMSCFREHAHEDALKLAPHAVDYE